jgi:hypothetical protein
MTNKHIIYIPGKNPKPQPEQHRELLWKTMTEGVRRADEKTAKALQGQFAQFHLISWNHLFYNIYKNITPDIPWIDALINKHGPSKEDIREANSWRARLGRILFTVADHLQFLIPLLPKEVESAAKEMNHYFNNVDNIACEIRELLKKVLRPIIAKNEPVLIIAHSLGSVIVYDTLWELTYEEKLQGKVDLLTIGSPLGMHYVRRHLLGMNGKGKISYPKLIRQWINISSEGDIIALERNFHEVFEEMLKQHLINSIEDHSHGIYNYFHNAEGLNCHRSYGYLVNPAVGHTIANWWKNN